MNRLITRFKARTLLLSSAAVALLLSTGACSSESNGPIDGAGGTPATGGASSGGASSGGASSGGASTGGTSTGGASTGGSSAGGSSAGGTSSGGGTADGGSSAGGAAVGGGTSDGGSGSGGEQGGGEFTLTSTDWVTDGDPIDPKHTCDGGGGQMNWGVAPQLTWTNPPEGTMSYAFFMIDWTLTMGENPSVNGYHSGAWNIPTSITELPAAWTAAADLPGAMAINGGYLGPCPPSGTDTYHVIIMALPMASYTINATGTQGVKTAYETLKEEALETVELTGTYMQQ